MSYKQLAGGVFLTAALALGAVAQAPAGSHWVGTWAASAQSAPATAPAIDNQTVRMVARVSLGGSAVRLHFSNAFGTQPVTLGDVHVALATSTTGTVPSEVSEGSAIAAGSDHAVTFSGHPSIVMPPGADVVSDPVAMTVPAYARLVVSVYVPVASGPITWHSLASQTGYIAGYGDFTARASLPEDARPVTHWYWLSGMDVEAPASAYAVVTLGDSITDGAHSTLDANHRWPDVLADKLAGVGVLNEGISGNRILHDEAGPNALARFNRDVLGQPGVRDLIILEGINDIGWSDEKGGKYANQAVSADEIIAGLKQIVDRAHAHGLRVYGATLTPFVGAGYQSEKGEAKREAVNNWIRTSGAFDGVIDFDKVTGDPAAPTRFLAADDSGDHLHPNDTGYQAMGAAAAKALAAAPALATTSRR